MGTVKLASARVGALSRAAWLSATSYRVRILVSIVGIVLSIIPIFFVTDALQDVVSDSINTESSQYFAFAVVGMLALNFVGTAVTILPQQISSGITTGTLEALLSTRSRLPVLLAGLAAFPLIWTGLRSLVLLVAAWLMGAEVVWSQLFPSLLVVLLIVLAHLPFGLMGAALILAFRTAGPLAQGVLFLSAGLGGVYYSTTVIPSWLQTLSAFTPLAYGLRALRRMILRGEPISAVGADIGVLCLFAIVLTAASSAGFVVAFRYARRAGTLTQY